MVLVFSPTSSNICSCQLPVFLDFTRSKISEGNIKKLETSAHMTISQIWKLI